MPGQDLPINCPHVMILSCMRVLFCFTVPDVMLMHCAQACLWKMVSRFLKLSEWFLKVIMKNKTKKSNDKTIIALGYYKISWFISVELIVLSLQFQEIGNVLTPQDSCYFALPLPDRSSAALSATNKLFDLFWPKSYFTSFSLFLPLAKNILILVFSWKCLNPKSVEFVICRGRCSHVSWNKI